MECGTCTLCCKLLNIEETLSKPGYYCKYCKENIGCDIYDDRPEACKIFECAWKQMEHVGIELRPDLCGVLFEKWSNTVMLGITVINNPLLDLIFRQIKGFNGEGISVLMINYKVKTRIFHLADGHTKDFVKDEMNRSIKNK